jgi:DNA-binding transcriptional regulator YhcF (GntR family)
VSELDKNPEGQTATREGTNRARILSQIRDRIVTGAIPVGGRVPKRESLASEFSVSIYTVQKALERLEADGFIESTTRRGTFVSARPPHLSRYALIFRNTPEASQPWSRFWSGLASEAERMNAQGKREISIFYGIDGHRDTDSYRRLVSEIRRERFAGLAFSTTPAAELIGTPVLSHPNLPRVACHDEKWMPGVKGIGTETWAFLTRAMDEVVARGRRRVAILTEVHRPGEYLEVALPFAAARGIDLPWTWVQQADARSPEWAAQVVGLLFDRPDGERPEALIIDDDNLVEPATAGLLRTTAGAAGEVLVVHHCNFPYPPHSLVPCIRIGFDLRHWLDACFVCIDQMRRGEQNVAVPRIPALRDDELTSGSEVTATAKVEGSLVIR